jgi:hypothetical protein
VVFTIYTQKIMSRFIFACTFLGMIAVSNVCWGQAANRGAVQDLPPLRYTYVPRNLSQEGDFKVVVVPATNPRQARIDAQTYHIGWDAVDAQEGQSRVMYAVLLRKRAPRVPGAPPVTRPIPKDQPNRR